MKKLLFAVMLTRRDLRDSGPQLNEKKWGAGFIAVLLYGLLAFLLSTWSGFWNLAPAVDESDAIVALGNALLQPDAYLLPFEVASVLLLAAMVGAVYVAANKK